MTTEVETLKAEIEKLKREKTEMAWDHVTKIMCFISTARKLG